MLFLLVRGGGGGGEHISIGTLSLDVDLTISHSENVKSYLQLKMLNLVFNVWLK
jgi:hypothetical protein